MVRRQTSDQDNLADQPTERTGSNTLLIENVKRCGVARRVPAAEEGGIPAGGRAGAGACWRELAGSGAYVPYVR
jgi:hypothetical protein